MLCDACGQAETIESGDYSMCLACGNFEGEITPQAMQIMIAEMARLRKQMDELNVIRCPYCNGYGKYQEGHTLLTANTRPCLCCDGTGVTTREQMAYWEPEAIVQQMKHRWPKEPVSHEDHVSKMAKVKELQGPMLKPDDAEIRKILDKVMDK